MFGRGKARWAMRFATVSLAMALCVLACACSNESGDGKAQGNDASVAVNWSMEVDCGVCHSIEGESMADASCEASSHVDMTCIQCHDDEKALSLVHEGKTAENTSPKKLRKTEVSNDLCLSCHYGTREALIEATSDVIVVDSEGTGRNPHDVGDVAEHGDIACADCHNMHDSNPIEDQAKDKCLSCHHADVFECGTCHE